MSTATRPMGPIQTAIYQRLTSDLDPPATVLDDVPEGAPHPYVTIGDAIETPGNTHGRFGRITTVNVHVWSKQRGFSEANAVGDWLTRMLDHQAQALTVPGHDVVSIRFEFSQTLRDPDPEIRHVAIRFRIRTSQQQ